MFPKKLLSASLALALTTTAHAGESAELAQLKKEVAAMRANYEARIQSLEKRLETAEAHNTPTASTVAVAAAPAPEPAPSVAPVAAAPSSDSAFNPAVSLILSGLYTYTAKDRSKYAITGFPVPADTEIGPGERGFSLAESELGFSANVDHLFRGAANIAFHADNTVSVEEAYVQTLGLNHGLTLKAGRFLSGIGYLNERHAHTWDFVDAPLAYQAFVGGQFGNDGVQARWLAPTDVYLELGAEAGNGANYPGTGSSGNGAGAGALYGHVGGDFNDSNSWRAGLSYLRAKASEQNTTQLDVAGDEVSNAFSGNTALWIADAVWKWAPNGNTLDRNLTLQGEYLYREQSGDLTYSPDGAASADRFKSRQSGWYLQGVYQFQPQWRLGLRGEQLLHGTVDYGLNSAYLPASTYDPSRLSLMLDYNPSEFSRIRLQFTRDRSQEGISDSQAFLQYQMSLGAHGAHTF